MIEIIRPGPRSTVQDRGRGGFAALGVSRSGAFDTHAAALANRLVGNDPAAALLEITLGGLMFVARAAMTVAMTGAYCPGRLEWGVPRTLSPGSEVSLGAPASGLRTYLAVRGGIAVAPTLGSRSTDQLSGLGPAALAAGDRLPVGAQPEHAVSEAVAPPRQPVSRVIVHAGPRLDWFSATARAALAATVWIVRPESDRIGIRLDGPALERTRSDELPSEPTLPGAIQVPPDGRPIILGPDAPVTGGYPVIAVLADLAQVAQLRPGDAVGLELR
jgi:biotin-dependent carboxylase-like uncharacterized protein